MNDDPMKSPVATKTPPKECTITGLYLAWHDGQPDYLGLTGLGDAIALFSSIENLEKARRELPFNGTEIKVVTDQQEFMLEVPGGVPVVIDPHRTPKGSVVFVIIKRD